MGFDLFSFFQRVFGRDPMVCWVAWVCCEIWWLPFRVAWPVLHAESQGLHIGLTRVARGFPRTNSRIHKVHRGFEDEVRWLKIQTCDGADSVNHNHVWCIVSPHMCQEKRTISDCKNIVTSYNQCHIPVCSFSYFCKSFPGCGTSSAKEASRASSHV